MDIHSSQEVAAPFDPFAAQPPEADLGEPPIQEAMPTAEAVTETGTEDANIGGMPLPISDYREAQHRIQLSDQVHVDIPDDMLNDAQAHLWKNGFPNMNQTDTIAALLRSGVVTQGTPIEGGNDFYREHGVIPNAQAADALRGYFQGGLSQESSAPSPSLLGGGEPSEISDGSLNSALAAGQPSQALRDQHELKHETAPDPGDLMRVLQPPTTPYPANINQEETERQAEKQEAAPENPSSSDSSRPSAHPNAANNAGGGRGFALPSFGLRSFIGSRAEHARDRQSARMENTRLDMAMDAAREALKGVDPYLPSFGLPEADRAMVYADRLSKDPEAHAAHYQMIGKFSRLRDTVEQWTDAAKDNPALQKGADQKLKAVDDLLKSGEVVPDATFKESLGKIAKAISEMFSRIFQKLGLSAGKSAEAGMGMS